MLERGGAFVSSIYIIWKRATVPVVEQISEILGVLSLSSVYDIITEIHLWSLWGV
jgi:hypothetical protein